MPLHWKSLWNGYYSKIVRRSFIQNYKPAKDYMCLFVVVAEALILFFIHTSDQQEY